MKKLAPILVVIGFALMSYLSIPKAQQASVDAPKTVETIEKTITPSVAAQAPPVAPSEPVEPPEPTYSVGAGCEQYRQLIAKYDWDVRTMMAIMEAESTNQKTGVPCDQSVTGDTTLTYEANGRTYGYSVSLFQVRILQGREHCDTHDPEVNVDCAYNVWKGQGYTAWSVYTDGKYQKYLR